jgi:hypothetical protein
MSGILTAPTSLVDGTNETILGPQVDVPVGDCLALNAGWTAFVKPGTTGQSQIWTRSPDGVQTQRTFFGFSSRPYALAPGGDIMVSGPLDNARLYFIPNASGPTLPTDLGPWNFPASPPFWSKGNWYAILGSPRCVRRSIHASHFVLRLEHKRPILIPHRSRPGSTGCHSRVHRSLQLD